MIGAGLLIDSIQSTGVSMSKSAIVGGVLVAALTLTGSAHAGWELGVGGTQKIDGEATWLTTVSYVTPQQRFPWELMAGFIDGRGSIGSGSVPDQYFVGVSKRYNFVDNFYASFGVAFNDRDTDVLSGHVQFQSALGWHYRRVGLSIRHLSNASIEGRNRGETFVLLQVGF